MYKESKIVFTIICLFAILGCSDKPRKDDSNHTRMEHSIDSIFNLLVTDDIFNGEILVAQKNEIIIHKHYGKANLISNDNFTDESVFEIASITKPFTALAIAKLVSENKLTYEDHITKFLPEFPYNNIKIKHLILHTSGLPDYNTLLYPNWDVLKIANNQNLLKILIDKTPKLLSNPGDKWSYSNVGYTLLAIIIEKVQDQTFLNYCEDKIFEPLGMNHTIIPNYEETKTDENYVNDYLFHFGNAKYVDPNIYPSFDNGTFTADMYGSSGICTNANDLYNFTKIFSSQAILPDSLYRSYISPQGIKTAISEDYTYGWFSSTDSILGKSLFSPGGFSGYRSFLEYYPDNETVIILLNNNSAPIWTLRKIIVNCLSNKEVEYPKKSYIKMLSFQLQEILSNKIDKSHLNNFNEESYILRGREFEDLIEELINNNQYDLAIMACEKISEINPDDYKPLFHIGDINFKKGNYSESLKFFQKALKLNPTESSIVDRINEINKQK